MSSISHIITTSIPYVNSNPHVGHVQEFALADALARYYRQQGGVVLLQSGTDDNATKNVLAAKAANQDTKTFVDKNSQKFQDILRQLNIKEDIFLRTSEAPHFKCVQDFLGLLKKEDVYPSKYQGLYCSGCEDFYIEKDLIEGFCPDHKKSPEVIEEENIFFRLSKYQSKIFELIKTDKIKITPSSRKAEILAFIAQGLNDISLSRSSLRAQGWGVPYPNVQDQTVYVWIDALINYLSGVGLGNQPGKPSVWSEDVYKIHVIGKNVWKFHAIYWPALLLSANLPLPNEIIIHGFLTQEGVKISKSLGNGADPLDIIRLYGADALRFYLLGVLSYEQDADFSEKNLEAAYNSELANKLGNLVSRVLTLAKQVEVADSSVYPQEQIAFQSLKPRAFEEINRINAEINRIKPWEFLKKGQKDLLQNQLAIWIADIKKIAALLEPIIPEATARLRTALAVKDSEAFHLFPRK